MPELGIGQRVYVGYVSDEVCMPDARHLRCTIATIDSGPFLPGSLVLGYPNTTNEPKWVLLSDNQEEFFAIESLIYPLDDGDPVEIEEEDEVAA